MPLPLISKSAPATAPEEPTGRRTLSQRLTHAGLTFLLFGTIIALLPLGDLTAATAGPCSAASYVMILSNDPPPTTSPTPVSSMLIPVAAGPGPIDLRVFISSTGGVPGSFLNADNFNFPGRFLKFALTNNPLPGSIGPITEQSTAVLFDTELPGSTGSYAVTPADPSIDSTTPYAGVPGTAGTIPSDGYIQANFILGGVTLTGVCKVTT